MIYTLTLNPALDITISADSLIKNSINKTHLKSVSAGGKGFNTSRALNCLGVKNRAIALCGGIFRKDIEKLLNDEKIDFHIIHISDSTRVNIKLIEQKSEKLTELNGEGPVIGKDEIENLMDFIKNINPKPGYFIISGSLPQNVDESIYFNIINICKSYGIKTLLDASGKPLYHGMLAVPDIVKINQNELGEVSDKYFNLKPEELIRRSLLKGLKMIMITNGPKQIQYFDQLNFYTIIPSDIKGLYKTGAGDCVNAGLIYALKNNFEIEERLKFAVSCGNANILSEIPGRFEISQVYDLIPNIKVQKLS
jgi:1-phosphofructokinase family hexose kinase